MNGQKAGKPPRNPTGSAVRGIPIRDAPYSGKIRDTVTIRDTLKGVPYIDEAARATVTIRDTLKGVPYIDEAVRATVTIRDTLKGVPYIDEVPTLGT